MTSPLVDLLGDLSRILDALGARWYLFGAQAALLYGAARFTVDVDVTVQLSAAVTTPEFAEHLQQHGFPLRIDDPAFVAQTRVIPVVHAASGVPVDIVLAGPGLEELFLDRAIARTIEGVTVPVASPEDVVVTKILAGRPKDLEDVAAILRAQRGNLDTPRVRTTLQQLEAALGQSDLIPLLEGIAARVKPDG